MKEWHSKAWIAVVAIPCIPVAYSWLCVEGPEWLRPVEKYEHGDVSALCVAAWLVFAGLVTRAVYCFVIGAMELESR